MHVYMYITGTTLICMHCIHNYNLCRYIVSPTVGTSESISGHPWGRPTVTVMKRWSAKTYHEHFGAY